MIIQSVVLGALQGVTEFLPISSSGHLIIVPALFGWQPGGLAFDVVVHVGTFFAVLMVFWKDVWSMLRGMGRSPKYATEGRLGWMILAATVPVVIVGVLWGDIIDAVLRTPWIVAMSLIVWGVVLGGADMLLHLRKARVKQDVQVGWRRALLIGLAQVIALIPGTSRSGITMSAGLLLGMSRSLAARFSFLLSLPAVGGAAAYVVWNAIQEGTGLFTLETLIGLVVSFIAGILAIRLLLSVIERWTFLPFALYRVILGVLVLLIVV